MVDQEWANLEVGAKKPQDKQCKFAKQEQLKQWLQESIETNASSNNKRHHERLDPARKLPSQRPSEKTDRRRWCKVKQFFTGRGQQSFNSVECRLKETTADQHTKKIEAASSYIEPQSNVDSGYAWIILTVMFFINASTFGTARAYGLIFEKLVRQGDQTRTEAALPFTIMGAIENMAGPMTGYLLTRTGSWRLTVFIGSSLITVSHLLAALLDSLSGQIVSMGFMCGLGLSFVTISSFQINNSYFVRYRSRAFGLGLTGAALGTMYISPLCQYVLNNYNHQVCYLMLGLILLPNVPLSLLLKPNGEPSGQPVPTQTTTNATKSSYNEKSSPPLCGDPMAKQICTISATIDIETPNPIGHLKQSAWESILSIVNNPLFHLIWTTQLLFCWFNFVFGMIIVDFGKDRGLDSNQVAKLIPIWAFGQLVGRLVLGSLVDFKLVSYELFTVICFSSIGAVTWTLNNVHSQTQGQEDILISLLVFILSMFISNLYILFNGLVVTYMDKSQVALSIGISSFTSSFFLLPRASTIGYYRDTIGNYDEMLSMFTYVALVAALLWLLVAVYKPGRRESPGQAELLEGNH